MSENLEYLNLKKSYDLYLTVLAKNGNFAGKLLLTPETITLTVMGENSDDRKFDPIYSDLNSIKCTDLNNTFVLVGLTYISGRWIHVDHSTGNSFFEHRYGADYVIFSPTNLDQDPPFNAIEINSKTIIDWLGHTNKQEAIVKKYHEGVEFFF